MGAESCGAQEAIMISIETRIINYFSKVRGKDRKRGGSDFLHVSASLS